ncbi:MAG: hypothetical protein J5801_08115 [Bacteroidales bacterium]|nr:hypothetical protein [Bacteroidales bacterium]
MNDSKINTYTYQVMPQDLDGKRHFRAVSLEMMLLNIAGKAAADRNFGAFKLIDNGGISWVLLKFAVEMSKMPSEDETLSISTWVEKVGSLLTTRNFEIHGQTGEIIGCATSEWAIIDLETRRPMNISVDNAIADCATGVKVPASLPGRLTVPEPDQNTPRHTVKVSYSDIDFNGHTNSMQYLQWMLDAYPIEKIYDRKISRLEIIYVKEVLYGETVDVYYKDCDDDITLFAVKAADGSDCVRAKITWKQL